MKRSILAIISATLIAFMAACDSGGGGGSERFSTVEIFASYDANPYAADARFLADTSQPPDQICNAGGIAADDIIADVTSTAYDPLPTGVDPCNVNILRYNLEYYPQSPAPPLAKKIVHQQINIPAPASAGSTVIQEVAIRIFDNLDKSYLNSFLFTPGDLGDPGAGCQIFTEFQYDVKVELTMEEVCTEIQEDVQFWVAVRYFDVLDESEGCSLNCP